MKSGRITGTGRLLLLSSACLLTGCARPTPIAPRLPPPPAEALIPCRLIPLPDPLTAEALEIWLRADARADAECEAKRASLAAGWPRL